MPSSSSCSSSSSSVVVVVVLLLLVLPPALLVAVPPSIGVTVSPRWRNFNGTCGIIPFLQDHDARRVRLIDPTDEILQQFLDAGIYLSIAVLNDIEVNSLANSTASAVAWLKKLGLSSTHTNKNITDFSIGYNVTAEVADSIDGLIRPEFRHTSGMVKKTLRGMVHLRKALNSISMRDAKVTTVFTFDIVTTAFPPSEAEFKRHLREDLAVLLNLLRRWSAPFQIAIHPYKLFRDGLCNVRFALFEVDRETEEARVDANSGLRYGNAFETMVDAVVVSLVKMGFDDLEVQVVETGWPQSGDVLEVEASELNAAEYYGRLLRWLLWGVLGTPLRPLVRPVTYLHSLMDDKYHSDDYRTRMGMVYVDIIGSCLEPRFDISWNGTYVW